MDSQPLPTQLEHLAARTFSFYPPIVGIEHNEWEYRRSTWSEILVVNRPSGLELWISRRYFGDVSRVEEPVLIAGLTRELEYSGGMLHPYKPRLVRMPGSSGGGGAPSTDSLKPFKGLQMGQSDTRVVKMVGIAVGALILLVVLAVAGLRIGALTGRRVILKASDQSYTLLNARDDRFAIVSKIGQPAVDSRKEVGTMQYEALSYPQRNYTVILMGTDVKTVKYIGTMISDKWEPIHWTTEYNNALLSDSLTRF